MDWRAAPPQTGRALGDPSVPVIDCSCCGSALVLPPDLREGAAFACPDCGAALRNVPFVREFRWESQDPYVRRHGVSRGNLWGAMIGSLVWVVVLAVLMLLHGRFSLGVLMAIAVPYLALLIVLRLLRPRRPALRWMMFLWMGLGAYFMYLAALQMLLKDWTDVMKTVAVASPALLLGLGGAWLATGFAGSWLYSAYTARLPRAQRAPVTPASAAAAPATA
jgi:hypothetical protein